MKSSQLKTHACCWLAALFLMQAVCPSLALDAGAMQSMVIIEGDQGRGSGFIVRMEGRVYVVTNAHVVQGNRKLSFKTLNNKELEMGPLEIADAADLVRAAVKGNAPALEMLQNTELKLQIGEEVVVAGNSEGEGVVREIPCKVVGIGPDRIEVDASFVMGNSGSPILRKATNEVIGVATYLKIPHFFHQSSEAGDSAKEQPVTSLNEVRRFGYRLDTVGRWINPVAADGIVQEGLMLAEIEKLDTTIIALVRAGTAGIVKMGSAGFIPADRRDKPRFAALAKVIDAFVADYKAAETPDQRKEPLMKLLGEIKSMTPDAAPESGLKSFNGYYSVMFRERLEWRKGLHEWLDFKSQEAGEKSWVIEAPWWRDSEEPVDIAKIQLPLQHEPDASAAPDKRHRISFPDTSRPASLRNIYWIIENPRKKVEEIEMHQTALRVTTPSNGVYRVHAEYRAGNSTRIVSNVVEFTVSDIPQPNVEIDFAEEPPLTLAPADEGKTPDWEKLKQLVAGEAYAKTPIVGRDGIAKVIKDIPDAGAVLIGLECILTPYGISQETVRGLRPVFLGQTGQFSGSVWGRSQGDTVFKAVAKPGYAVGRISGQFDGTALRCIKIRFDRICGLQLNPQDSYETAWIGARERLAESSADTNGRLPVGISGKHGGGLDGLRLVCLTGEEPAVAGAQPSGGIASPEDIVRRIPQALLEKLGNPATRKAGLEEINRFLATTFKGQTAEMEVRVEQALPISPPTGNALRLKIPEAMAATRVPIRSRVWFYFKQEDVPATTPAVGSVITLSGQIGRCEMTGDRPFLLNVDLQKSRQTVSGAER